MSTPPPETAESTKVLTDAEAGLKTIGSDYAEKFGFHDPETGYAYKAPKGLSRELVESISEYKNEPAWMREFRLKALDHFEHMRGEKNRGAMPDLVDKDVFHQPRAHGIHAFERLVHQEQSRPVNECRRHGDSLPHAL